MRMAIDIANENIKTGGGPFGAVIVCDGEIAGIGVNHVTNLNDPTAHAEVMAIREASHKLGRFDLSNCVIYTSCEPCPMCLGAIYWAKIKRIFYGNTRKDASHVGFDDDFIYKEISLPIEKRDILMQRLLSDAALETFTCWEQMPDKKRY